MAILKKQYRLKLFVLLAQVFLFGQLIYAAHDHEHEQQPTHDCIACLHNFNEQNDHDEDHSDDPLIDIDNTGLIGVINLDLHKSVNSFKCLNRDQDLSLYTGYQPPARGPPSER